jgi:hypothetical protein
MILDVGPVRYLGKAPSDVVDVKLKAWIFIPSILPEDFSMGFSPHFDFISIAINHNFPLLGDRVYSTCPDHNHGWEKKGENGNRFMKTHIKPPLLFLSVFEKGFFRITLQKSL